MQKLRRRTRKSPEKMAVVIACILLGLISLSSAAMVSASGSNTIGVKPGDWVVYGDVSFQWKSNETQTEELLSSLNITWMKVEVLDVSDTNVTSRLTAAATNGSETNMTGWWDTAAFNGNTTFPFFIPSGLDEGDLIPGSQSSINNTVMRHYAGADRIANCFNGTQSTTDYDNTTDTTTDTETRGTFYWDQETGCISELEFRVALTATNSSASNVTDVSLQVRMTATNMWPAAFTVHDGYSYDIIVSSNSTISNVDFNETLKQIRLNVTGPTGWTSYSNITVPQALLAGDPWTVYVNDTDYTSQCSIVQNATDTFVYVPYASGNNIIIISGTRAIPEFSQSLVILMLAIATLLTVIVHRRKRCIFTTSNP